jgi:DnaJ family protein C protein 3
MPFMSSLPSLSSLSFFVLCLLSLLLYLPSPAASLATPKITLSASELKSLGDVSLEKGDFATALSHYSDLITLSPSQLTYFHRANAYLRKRAYAQAVADLSSAVKADEKFIKGFLFRAKVLKITGRCTEAALDYQHVLQLQATHKEALAELPKVQQCVAQLTQVDYMMEQRHFDGAKQVLTSLLDVAYDSSALLLLRATCHFHTSDYQSVLVDTRKILQHDQRNLDALFLRGQAYFALGEHDNAMTHYKEALRQDPEEKRVKEAAKKLRLYLRHISGGEEAVGEKRWEEAIESFSAALDMDEKERRTVKTAWLQTKKCEAQVGAKKGKEAVQSCNAAIQLEDNNIDAWMKRGEAKLLLEDWQDAVNDFQKATQIDQHSQQAQEGLRRAQAQLKISLQKDYYKELGVGRTASDREIKKAFRKLALQYHPDKISQEPGEEGDRKRDEAEKKFREIAEAYEVLSDEELKGKYDRGEDIKPQQGGGQQQQGGFGGFHGFQGFPGGGFGGGQQFHFKFGR